MNRLKSIAYPGAATTPVRFAYDSRGRRITDQNNKAGWPTHSRSLRMSGVTLTFIRHRLQIASSLHSSCAHTAEAILWRSGSPLHHLQFQAGRHHLLEPFVECVVQVDVGQERAYRLPLSCPCFAHEQFAVFDDSDLDPFPDSAVSYAFSTNSMRIPRTILSTYERMSISRVPPSCSPWWPRSGTSSSK
jgi:hypothetical protein